jgi:hypothetical protein
MHNGTITLDQKGLEKFILRLNWCQTDRLSDEDIHILKQIRLFFTVNIHLVSHAAGIKALTLAPRGDGQPPLAEVTITRQLRTFCLRSDEKGRVPRFHN